MSPRRKSRRQPARPQAKKAAIAIGMAMVGAL
jgi:hypothetical protein